MDTDYRIEPVGSQYIVVDPWDEIVGVYPKNLVAFDF